MLLVRCRTCASLTTRCHSRNERSARSEPDYRVEHSETVGFQKAPPLTVDQGAFRVEIDAGKMKIEMVDHFATVEEARARVQPFLDAWELEADLNDPSDRFRFIYERPEIIDRAPSRDGTVMLTATGLIVAVAMGTPTLHVGRAKWPEPPVSVALSPDVDSMRRRWVRYSIKQGEPLLAAAYWALTMLEAAPGVATPAMRSAGNPTRRPSKKRLNASTFFNIDYDVLAKLGELVSTRGGDDEARKAEGRSAPLSPAEKEWVKAAFRAIVRRVAEREYHKCPPPKPLTMKDLPP